ncbi:MAG: hypothetical protein RQ930_02190 [Candidatus Aenigmarchaeota archaeon]|nr:hypothetical protein [Candidatus Aenigmarchaeota archaeon]
MSPSHFSTYILGLYLLMSNEFVTTLTELKAIAAAAIMGFNNIPKNGYNMPAAIGIAATL